MSKSMFGDYIGLKIYRFFFGSHFPLVVSNIDTEIKIFIGTNICNEYKLEFFK